MSYLTTTQYESLIRQLHALADEVRSKGGSNDVVYESVHDYVSTYYPDQDAEHFAQHIEEATDPDL